MVSPITYHRFSYTFILTFGAGAVLVYGAGIFDSVQK